MFNWQFASKLFEGFSILRWTDFIKPVDFVEIEKHALKSALTYIIGKEYEAESGRKLDWRLIVGDNVFGLLQKLATSDIKSPLHAQIKSNERVELNNFILDAYFDADGKFKYYPQSEAGEIISRKELADYLERGINGNSSAEERISYFCHKYVTYREFSLIGKYGADASDYPSVEGYVRRGISADVVLNGLDCESGDYEILKKIFSQFSPDITCGSDKPSANAGGEGGSVAEIAANAHATDGERRSALYSLYTYVEKLKPQTRWAQTCRMPMTSVLGHCMYVAALAYFTCRELAVDDECLTDTFYAALFHDLPESLTRDIISPVKNKVINLDRILNHLEFELVNDNIIAKLDNKSWKDDFCAVLGMDYKEERIDEFSVRRAGNGYILGDLVRYMDKIAAFIEAKMSKNFGVSSSELENGIMNTQTNLLNKTYPSAENPAEIARTLHLNDFFASIPHYTVGAL